MSRCRPNGHTACALSDCGALTTGYPSDNTTAGAGTGWGGGEGEREGGGTEAPPAQARASRAFFTSRDAWCALRYRWRVVNVDIQMDWGR